MTRRILTGWRGGFKKALDERRTEKRNLEDVARG
jgi:hypothetical protein